MVAGPKFGSEAGKNMITRKALYVLKISGVAFRAFLADTLDAIGYRPSYADPYLCLRPEVKPDGFRYYEYIIFNVDDVLCISHNQRKSMKRIQDDFNLKYYKIEPTDIHIVLATWSNNTCHSLTS